MTYADSYTITNPDVTNPVIDTLAATGTDPDTIDVSFNTNENNGTRYVFASANPTEIEADIITGAQATTTVTASNAQTDTLTLAVGNYYVHVLHEDAAGNPSNILVSGLITLAAAATSAEVVLPYVAGADDIVATLEPDFLTYAFEQWPADEPAALWQLVTLTADGAYFDSQGNWYDTGPGVYNIRVIDLTGMVYEQTVDTQNLQTTTPTEVPQGTWTIGTITKDQNSASFTPTYSLTDATSYEYSLNGGAYTAFTGTISLSGLSAETAYSGNVKAVNGAGDGAAQAFSFTTEAVPVGDPIIELLGGTSVTAEAGEAWPDPGYNATDATGGTLTAVITGSANTSTLGEDVIQYTVTDSEGRTTTATRTVTTIDTKAPVLTLEGGNVTLAVGEAYVEPGYDALDSFEGDLTGAVSVGGSVNTSTDSTNLLVYSVADSSGNIATRIRRVVVGTGGALTNRRAITQSIARSISTSQALLAELISESV
jgi:hypothetical protein